MGRKLYAKGQNFNPTTGIDDVEGLREELDALKGGTSGGGGDTIEIERRLTTAEDEIDALQGDVAEQSKEIAKIGSKVSTLQGSDTGKSVRAIAAEETAKIVGGAPANYDTLKEIADYISADATGAAELKNKVNKNAQDIGNLKSTTDQLEESMQDLSSEVGENYAAFIEEIGVINSKDKSQDTRIDNIEERVTDLETEVYHPDRGNEVLHRVVWGVDSRVDELENNVNNKASKSEAQSYANIAETNAKEYADSLSGNYDAKGSAANAVQSAKTYTDTKINEVNSDIDSLTFTVDGKLGKTEQAASASKLTTPVKIWGQTFDGSKDISETSPILMKNADSTRYGEITANTFKIAAPESNSWAASVLDVYKDKDFTESSGGPAIGVHGAYGDITYYYFGGTYSKHLLRLHPQQALATFYTNVGLRSGRKLGIGTLVPDYPLHVVGNGYVTGTLQASGFIGNVQGNLQGTADKANTFGTATTFEWSRSQTGGDNLILIADLTDEWDKTSSATHHGLTGMFMVRRITGYPDDKIVFISARTGYSYNGASNNNRNLYSSHPDVIPCIVTKDGKYYLAIRWSGYDVYAQFIGHTYNLLDNFIWTTYQSAEVLYEGTIGYNAVMNRSIYADGVRENSSTRGTTANVGSKYGNDRALHYFIATSSITDGSAPEGHILHMSWDSGATAGMWAAQLLVSHTSARGLQRRYTGGTHSWSAWIDILDANNFHNYALPIKGGTIDGVLQVTDHIDCDYISAREVYANEQFDCYGNASIDGSLTVYEQAECTYLQVNSNATINGSMTASASYHSSDDRLKTYEEDVDIDLERIKQLPKKYFHWTSDADGKRQLGTSAQAVREIYPELVNEDKDGYLSVNYANLSVVALAAVDKLAEQNKALEERLKRIEKLLNIE